MGRVFVTGDIHASLDIAKLTPEQWPLGNELTRDDYLLICGDFGLVWSEPPSPKSAQWLDWLDARPWTTLFVDGNHENHDLLDAMDVSVWHGGRVHVLPGHPHVLHLMRGQVYEMGEHGRWFTFGGATSSDRMWRVEGYSWWAREKPSEAEYDEGQAALERNDWQVDYVFTHDVPSELKRQAMAHLPGVSPVWEPPCDQLEEYLQWVDERLDPARLKRWYCGHYHGDKLLNDERHVLLYQQIVELGELPRGWGA